MFRAAFPNAPDADEKAEIQWVKENYDLSGNNGSTKDPHITRLAGTWVDPELATQLGKVYSLGALVDAIVDATPDPNGTYRRSIKAGGGGSTTAPTPAVPPPTVNANTTTPNSTVQSPPTVQSDVKTLPTPSPTTNPPAKRRKESSPAPSSHSATSSKTPSRLSPSLVKSPAATRRSTRKSPASSPAIRAESPFSASGRTPKRGLKKEQSLSRVSKTPSKRELKTVDEEVQMVEDGVAGSELMEEDIKEQKKLIKDLEEMRQQQQLAALAKSDKDEIMGYDCVENSSVATATKKREREDEDQPLTFDFKEPEKEERPIATNRRVGRFHLQPRTKSFAWGVAAFAVGMSAM